MSSHRQNDVGAFPEIETGYVDEYGYIDRDVYVAATALWPELKRYALKVITDETQARDLLVRTIARVSQRKDERGEIVNLRGYVFTVYRNLLLEQLRVNRRRPEAPAVDEFDRYWSLDDELDRSILVRQLFRRMDPQTREVFELLTIGFSFNEIAERLAHGPGQPEVKTDRKPFELGAPALRNKFRRRMLRLAEQIRHEIGQAPSCATAIITEPYNRSSVYKRIAMNSAKKRSGLK